MDFQIAMQDVYDLFHDINSLLLARGQKRPRRDAAAGGDVGADLRPADRKPGQPCAKPDGERVLQRSPDLIVAGFYPNDRVQAGSEGIEIKSTRKKGGAVDTHGARDQWMCVFVYEVDTETEPARDRRPMSFTEVYLAHVGIDDFRSNPRGELGTRTATLHRDGVRKLREHWVYRV